MRSRWRSTLVIALFAFLGACWAALAQTNATVADRVYSEAQAARGQAIYQAQCRACHGAALEGGLAPPLSGADFLRGWNGRALAQLADKIERTMPASNPGTLSRAQATELVASLLKASAFPAGTAELTGDTLGRITLVGPAGGRPPGNMAQVMRGILFPSSNLIFNVQNVDPGEQKVGWQPGGPTAFSWVDWGAGIYSGWELVDYAAVALAESAPLLLTPGRRCENGRPAPVERADWVKFTAELAGAGRAAYAASQSRNRDAVIETTNQIAEACLNCHEVYRDKPGGTTTDPSNKAARCY
ncbi:MAG: cytochrome c [Acidobacteria bacterium]|nr:cytochrome c [Acidobacteriota bacterium]